MLRVSTRIVRGVAHELLRNDSSGVFESCSAPSSYRPDTDKVSLPGKPSGKGAGVWVVNVSPRNFCTT